MKPVYGIDNFSGPGPEVVEAAALVEAMY